jgi:hypothetical protein
MSRWDDDEVLANDLLDALRSEDEVPPGWRDAARGAFAWRSVDRDLLMLADEGALAAEAVRGPADPRMLSFAGGELTLEVEVNDERVMGQVLPPREHRLALESPGEPSRSTTTDPSGVFVLDRPHRGPVRFCIDVDGATRRTEWVVL